MPSLNLSPSFAVPIVNTGVAGGEQLNPRLRERFLAWENDEGRRSSMPTEVLKHAVYESDFSLFTREDPVVSELARLCLSALGELIMQINDYSSQEMRDLRIYHHSWYHITRHGGYTSAHNHPMASWSGVYCVTPGETPANERDSGSLRFLDPRPNPAMYLDPGNSHIGATYAPGALAFRLVPGQLLLFPSWLMHEVTPFWGRDERITVAFNAWVREASQAVDEPGIRLRSKPAA